MNVYKHSQDGYNQGMRNPNAKEHKETRVVLRGANIILFALGFGVAKIPRTGFSNIDN